LAEEHLGFSQQVDDLLDRAGSSRHLLLLTLSQQV
jgi:hypothetical protein